ncbi:MAG: enoyl-CoA hydratase-related protein, partial [Actinobacteria bacterium]|nr:enoyl-CoA hydratase-related protein [Actinomycetota bacterium]
EALALADSIAKNAPTAVRVSKSVMLQAAELSEAAAWAINDAAFGEIGASPDAMEGAIAFAEKREPNWQAV